MGTIILYHGSPNIIEKPELKKGKSYNDYGRGFYCTEHIELAKEWACNEGISGFANQYELDMTGLRILNLSDESYSILHWLAVLVDNRRFRISTPAIRKNVDWLKKNYLLDISKYDVIRGYRADDAYFSFTRAFLNNGITLEQLNRAMLLGELGEQVVLRKEKAFNQLKFLGFEAADYSEYYVLRKERDEAARSAYEEELEQFDAEGKYISDLIKG